jgi:hypothetical protein
VAIVTSDCEVADWWLKKLPVWDRRAMRVVERKKCHLDGKGDAKLVIFRALQSGSTVVSPLANSRASLTSVAELCEEEGQDVGPVG